MTKQVIDFVEAWLLERVPPGHDIREGQEDKSVRLAEQLMLDAEMAGIPRGNIDAHYPDLAYEVAHMLRTGKSVFASTAHDPGDLRTLDPVTKRDSPASMLGAWKQELEADLKPLLERAALVEWNGEDVTMKIRRRYERDLKRIQRLIDLLNGSE